MGHLQSAVNMPLHLLNVKHRLLNQNKHYVTYCASGSRSASACSFLSKLGYSVSVLQGGTQAIDVSALRGLTTLNDCILRDGEVVELPMIV